jgi:hypothetical protein
MRQMGEQRVEGMDWLACEDEFEAAVLGGRLEGYEMHVAQKGGVAVRYRYVLNGSAGDWCGRENIRRNTAAQAAVTYLRAMGGTEDPDEKAEEYVQTMEAEHPVGVTDVETMSVAECTEELKAGGWSIGQVAGGGRRCWHAPDWTWSIAEDDEVSKADWYRRAVLGCRAQVATDDGEAVAGRGIDTKAAGDPRELIPPNRRNLTQDELKDLAGYGRSSWGPGYTHIPGLILRCCRMAEDGLSEIARLRAELSMAKTDAAMAKEEAASTKMAAWLERDRRVVDLRKFDWLQRVYKCLYAMCSCWEKGALQKQRDEFWAGEQAHGDGAAKSILVSEVCDRLCAGLDNALQLRALREKQQGQQVSPVGQAEIARLMESVHLLEAIGSRNVGLSKVVESLVSEVRKGRDQ